MMDYTLAYTSLEMTGPFKRARGHDLALKMIKQIELTRFLHVEDLLVREDEWREMHGELPACRTFPSYVVPGPRR